MTLLDTRVRLLGTLLRSGDAPRIARLVDRLHPGDLSRLILSLDDLELRRAAQVVLHPDRVARTIDGVDLRAVARLVDAAGPADAARALELLPPRGVASVLALVAAARRARLLDLLPAHARAQALRQLPRGLRPAQEPRPESSLGAALRLRRLFA